MGHMVCCTEGCCIRQCQVWQPMRFLLTCPMVACLQVGRACLLVSRACRPVATPWECHVKPSAPTTKHATTQQTCIVGEDPRLSQRSCYYWEHASGVSAWQEPQTFAGYWKRIFDEYRMLITAGTRRRTNLATTSRLRRRRRRCRQRRSHPLQCQGRPETLDFRNVIL